MVTALRQSRNKPATIGLFRSCREYHRVYQATVLRRLTAAGVAPSRREATGAPGAAPAERPFREGSLRGASSPLDAVQIPAPWRAVRVILRGSPALAC